MRDVLINLLFPLRCPVCDDIVPVGEGKVCRSCRPKIRYIVEPTCRKCGRQLNDHAKVFCMECEKTKHIFDRGVALYDYQSMKKSIFRFKCDHGGEACAGYCRACIDVSGICDLRYCA